MSNYLLPYTGKQVEDRLESPLPVALGGTGQTTAYQNVALTPDTATAEIREYKCRYYPYLGIVFLRGWCMMTSASAAGTWFNVATIPADYRPASNAAFTVSVPGGGSGLAETGGNIRMRTYTARAVDTSIDFSGWWYV